MDRVDSSYGYSQLHFPSESAALLILLNIRCTTSKHPKQVKFQGTSELCVSVIAYILLAPAKRYIETRRAPRL